MPGRRPRTEPFRAVRASTARSFRTSATVVRGIATASSWAPCRFHRLTWRRSCRRARGRGPTGARPGSSFVRAATQSRSASRRPGGREPPLRGGTGTKVCSTLFALRVALGPRPAVSPTRAGSFSAPPRLVYRSSSASAGGARPSASVSGAAAEAGTPSLQGSPSSRVSSGRSPSGSTRYAAAPRREHTTSWRSVPA